MTSKVLFFFFFNDTATTEIYTLSLHDALPISARVSQAGHSPDGGRLLHAPGGAHLCAHHLPDSVAAARRDRKSTRLNSSHGYISYAVFCLKKKIINRFT